MNIKCIDEVQEKIFRQKKVFKIKKKDLIENLLPKQIEHIINSDLATDKGDLLITLTYESLIDEKA